MLTKLELTAEEQASVLRMGYASNYPLKSEEQRPNPRVRYYEDEFAHMFDYLSQTQKDVTYIRAELDGKVKWLTKVEN